MATRTSNSHRWSFFRAGGVDQVLLESGADILNLENLDQKLWVALSCPVKGLEFDERTLQLLDTDKDGRVRAPEILAATRWLKKVLAKPDGLLDGSETMPLSAIHTGTPEGKIMLGAAKQILEGLGKGDETEISVADAMETAKIFGTAKLNGDGIVPPESIDDAALRKVAEEVVACMGGTPDRSGKSGFNAAAVDAFFAELQALADWHKLAEADAKGVMPLGEGTAPAHAAMTAVANKIEDYFARCRLAAFDARAQALLNQAEAKYLEIAAKDLSVASQDVAHFPLAQIEAGRALPTGDKLNPAWAGAMATFQKLVVEPLLGADKKSLSEADFATIRGKFVAFEGWNATKGGAKVAGLGIKRAKDLLASKAKELLHKAIAQDLTVAKEFEGLAEVERLTRYYRDLYQLLNNFVAFGDFYSRKRPAVFQAGTLYLDGRSCDLCVRVDDPGKHGVLATLAKSYLAYCDVTRPSGEKMTIAAAFTAGDSDHLMVGRNGLFYDRKGRDWDATITKIVDNPISIRQAFFGPYKKLLRWIEESVAKRAAAADEASTSKLIATAQATGEAATQGPAAAPKPKFDVGVVAALGVGVGAITAAIGGLLESFLGLGKWIPFGVIGLLLAISGPAMLIAWMKLRQRNLGPILDANGWAVNGRMKVNVPLGGALTETATLPAGSNRLLTDPFAPKKSPWPKIIIGILFLAGLFYAVWRWEPAPSWLKDAQAAVRNVIPYTPPAPTPAAVEPEKK